MCKRNTKISRGKARLAGFFCAHSVASLKTCVQIETYKLLAPMRRHKHFFPWRIASLESAAGRKGFALAVKEKKKCSSACMCTYICNSRDRAVAVLYSRRLHSTRSRHTRALQQTFPLRAREHKQRGEWDEGYAFLAQKRSLRTALKS